MEHGRGSELYQLYTHRAQLTEVRRRSQESERQSGVGGTGWRERMT